MASQETNLFTPHDLQQRRAQYHSLPGQQMLFDQQLCSSLRDEELEAITKKRSELFYTGKDLPGATETSQAILWDVQ